MRRIPPGTAARYERQAARLEITVCRNRTLSSACSFPVRCSTDSEPPPVFGGQRENSGRFNCNRIRAGMVNCGAGTSLILRRPWTDRPSLCRNGPGA